MRTIDVDKCKELAKELLRLVAKDERFRLLPNYELEAVLVFAVSLNSFLGGKLSKGEISDN